MAAGDVHLTASLEVPTAAEIAAAVWDESADDHATLGSTGGALVAAGGAADPLLNRTVDYPAGSAGRALERLIGGPLSIIAPYDRAADLRLVVGDDYLAAQGRQIDIDRVEGDSWPADLTGWDITWRAHSVEHEGAELVAETVSVLDAVAPGQRVRVELSHTVTAQLARGTSAWRLLAVSGGVTVTLRHGRLIAV
jgi:hypothetical protein